MVMRTAIEQAGAERGLLIHVSGDVARVEAEARTGPRGIQVELRDAIPNEQDLPVSLFHRTLQTGDHVITDDALADSRSSLDPYVVRHGCRSIMFLALHRQSRRTGVLYLENNLVPAAFHPRRITILKLLASQAAISIENARLYRDLANREAKINSLVNANIIGIIVWNSTGAILEANDAFLRMVGYERCDLVTGLVRWTDLTPDNFHARSMEALDEARRCGRAEPYEKEYFRKDGSRVPVIVGLATFPADVERGVAFVLDISERKRSEQKILMSEDRLREFELELERASRIATMGHLTASIAHEIKQPIAATITNAQAALRWLKADPPEPTEVSDAIARIVKDAMRASDVLARIRAMIKNAPPKLERVDLNEAVNDVIDLTRAEAARCETKVDVVQCAALPLIRGDRVGLQQVLLNLMLNALEALKEAKGGARILRIETSRQGTDEILVVVADTGPGFSTELKKRLFTPFLTTKLSGMGMGLSICRSIIESHGGRLWASDNAPQGARLQFTIPVDPTSPRANDSPGT
ncbi:PAS domain S-box-containing protein [Cupriavidus agavae]|uniref:histidine kinase n=2 Tax=Cupriavidus agavae TaxID=1001822 RepID=A0A4Q7RAH7_9BURK|nr:PAS domain S-box-containing protein [Cupriavidus agavae]